MQGVLINFLATGEALKREVVFFHHCILLIHSLFKILMFVSIHRLRSPKM